MVSPQFGLSRRVVGDDICSCGQVEEGQRKLWGGKVVARRSGCWWLTQLALHSAWWREINSEPNDSHSPWSKGRYSFSHRITNRLRLSGPSLSSQSGSVFTLKKLSWQVSTAHCQVMCRTHVASNLHHFNVKVFLNKFNKHCVNLCQAVCPVHWTTVHIFSFASLDHHTVDTGFPVRLDVWVPFRWANWCQTSR